MTTIKSLAMVLGGGNFTIAIGKGNLHAEQIQSKQPNTRPLSRCAEMVHSTHASPHRADAPAEHAEQRADGTYHCTDDEFSSTKDDPIPRTTRRIAQHNDERHHGESDRNALRMARGTVRALPRKYRQTRKPQELARSKPCSVSAIIANDSLRRAMDMRGRHVVGLQESRTKRVELTVCVW